MPSKSTHTTARNFNPMSTPSLSDEARKAVNAAFDAMSAWRTETSTNSEKSFEEVTEKMAEAARALGWPEQIVDATRSQIQSITKMQIQTMDQIMDAWEGQIKSPNPSKPRLWKLTASPNPGPVDAWSSAAQIASMNPLQIYMQFAEQWQKACADAMAYWGQRRGP
jgi:hypothetical protein